MDTLNSAILRWATLFAVILNVLFNYSYVKIFSQASMGEVSARYPSLFTPSGYAFSIWGLIYIAFIFYCIIQLQKSRLPKKIYNQISLPLLLSNLLAGVWIWVYTNEMLLLSVVIILALLFLSIEMFIVTGKAASQSKHSWWLQFPFSLFFGWLSVAFLANLSVFVAGEQGKGNAMLAFIMLTIAGLAAIIISFRFKNAVYPAVIAWATVAIASARKNDHTDIANGALAVSIVSIIMVIIAVLQQRNLKRQREQ